MRPTGLKHWPRWTKFAVPVIGAQIDLYVANKLILVTPPVIAAVVLAIVAVLTYFGANDIDASREQRPE